MRSAIAALVVTAACTVQEPPRDLPAATSFVDVHEIPVYVNVKVDLLFVIDDSPAMAEHAAVLATQYRHMMDVLAQTAYGEPPDLHIGVVTADPADVAGLRTGNFLADAPRFAFRRERNYDGTLADAFASLASVGAAGTADVQPLAVLQRALEPGINPGFVRDHALLAVVILTAGDDHGTAAVDTIARDVKATKVDPSAVVVAVAGGCAGAPRLDAFAAQFPNRSAHASLCDADLGPLVAIVNQLQRWSLGVLCLDRPPAVPHDCSSWLLDPDSDDQVRLPECRDASDTHCWSVEPDDIDCGRVGSTALHYHPFVFPFPATARLECVVAPP